MVGISLSSKIYYLFRLTQRLLDCIQENLDEGCTLTLSNLIAKVRDEFQVVVCCSKCIELLEDSDIHEKEHKT